MSVNIPCIEYFGIRIQISSLRQADQPKTPIPKALTALGRICLAYDSHLSSRNVAANHCYETNGGSWWKGSKSKQKGLELTSESHSYTLAYLSICFQCDWSCCIGKQRISILPVHPFQSCAPWRVHLPKKSLDGRIYRKAIMGSLAGLGYSMKGKNIFAVLQHLDPQATIFASKAWNAWLSNYKEHSLKPCWNTLPMITWLNVISSSLGFESQLFQFPHWET